MCVCVCVCVCEQLAIALGTCVIRLWVGFAPSISVNYYLIKPNYCTINCVETFSLARGVFVACN